MSSRECENIVKNEQLSRLRSDRDGCRVRGRSKSKSTDSRKPSDHLNTLVQEQVDMIKESQENLLNLVESIDLCEQEVNLDTVESVADIVMKSEDLIVMVQVIIKVRNELGHARLDLEKAKKAYKMVNESKERVKWLEQKLEKLLVDCHHKASYLLKKSSVDGITKGVSLKDTYLSSSLKGELSPSQCERILCDVGGYTRSEEDEVKKRKHCNMAVKVVESSQRMIAEGYRDDCNQKDSSTSIHSESLDNNPVSTGSLDGISMHSGHRLTDQFPTVEEKAEEDSLYLRSSVRAARPSEEILEDPLLHLDSRHSFEESVDDEVDKYWRSDHHKFEWPDMNVQNRTPLSWHSLGLPIQDSFISKERPIFTPDLPWKERATQVNSVLDIHKLALDKLYAKLHYLYDAIEKATKASINPVPKNDKIEARLGNIESKPSSTQNVASKTWVNKEIEEKGVGRNLPALGAETGSRSRSSESRYHVDGVSSPAVRTPRIIYPRHSSVWCSSPTPGGRVVKKITTKTQAKPNRTHAILTKKMKTEARTSAKQRERQEAMIWRPSIVYKMVRATKVLRIFQVQIKAWNAARRSGPRWKRVKWLLGPAGLQSPTRAIVIESLKSLSELRCSEEEVETALKNIVSKSKDPRIMYEASKALILSGHWCPLALETLINVLMYGAINLKVEILDALASMEDIPFFHRKTETFKQLKSVLEKLVKGSDSELAFASALCLGKLCVVNPTAKMFLKVVLKTKSLTSKQRGQALNILVRQMNCKDDTVVKALLHELSTSINWKVRVQAADLLMFLGTRHVLAENPDEVFVILDRLLWDHAHQEVRSKVAELMNGLRWRKRACSLVLKRLEDREETVRARAIISLATLEMKGGKELKTLLDILALDSSVYARIQAVRAFSKLRWNDPRVLRSLREREKGEGLLAKEARKALEQITQAS